MSIFKKISDFVTRTQYSSSRSYYIYIVCDRCGEKIKSRVDLFNDLSIRYGEEDLSAESETAALDSLEKIIRYARQSGGEI